MTFHHGAAPSRQGGWLQDLVDTQPSDDLAAYRQRLLLAAREIEEALAELPKQTQAAAE